MINFTIKILGLILAGAVVSGFTYKYIGENKEIKNTLTRDDSSLVSKVLNIGTDTNELFSGDKKCIFESSADSAFGKIKTLSTLYISGEDILTVSEIDSMGKILKSNILIKDNVTYMWSSASEKIGAKTTSKTGESLSDSYKKSIQAIYKNCESWSVENNTFDLPPEIDFKEIGLR